MHESFHKDDPHRFTRPWFSWANAMYAELALDIAGLGVARPRYPRTSRSTSVSVAASTVTRVRVGSSTAKATSDVSWWNQSVNAMNRSHR